MKKFAFIFPGQGAQKTGMGLDLYNNFACAKSVFDSANSILSRDIKGLCFEGSEEELKLTINSQLAILTTSIAALEVFRETSKIEPLFCAGHSLGEYSAMYASSVMNLENVLLAVQKRAELMNYAAQNTKGSMLAILGLEPEKIKDVLKNIDGVISIANYNNKNQTVVTGEIAAIEKATSILKENGARRVIPLSVSGAFHSELMREAGIEFGEFVKKLDINNAKVPLITNVDSEITLDSDDFREKMPKQIYSSVYWMQSIQKMVDNGVEAFIELGEGNVLGGLNKKICPELSTYSISNKETLTQTIENLGG